MLLVESLAVLTAAGLRTPRSQRDRHPSRALLNGCEAAELSNLVTAGTTRDNAVTTRGRRGTWILAAICETQRGGL